MSVYNNNNRRSEFRRSYGSSGLSKFGGSGGVKYGSSCGSGRNILSYMTIRIGN